MSRDMDENLAPIESREQLVEYFRGGEKPCAQWGVGTEHEKFLYRRSDYEMVSYEEPGGIGEMLATLADEHGWAPSLDRGNIVALEKDSGAITLEPGGQLELSGAVRKTIFETADELDAHLDLIRGLVGDRLAMVCWGLNPFFEPPDIPWMPKSRYAVMRDYLPTRGDLAHWMMKLTCTVQANFDYESEEDAAEMMRTALLISPIVSAIFANSPIKAGEESGQQTYRGYLWTRTDPDRTGWPEFMYRDDWGYADYLDYILDVPMFFIRREGKYIDKSGDSFREFIEQGHDGYDATMGDFELHLSTAFPEIRLKRFIEVRGADAGPRDHMLAVSALWKGILYDHASRAKARDIIGEVTPERHARLFMDAYKDGLDAEAPRGRLQELAQELVKVAGDGLDAIAEECGHDSERGFLAPAEEIAETGVTLADKLLADWREFDGDRKKLVEEWAL
ncbi:glutamate--cysteine ligase [Persicimonas caeni]|uniref:Glutamate--cysteine ligase n=1 Tax=Persicimonas caeni TaxID=2292766 RepID=A0A4Y6PZK2_PERCE|nr:glutamate-cysteine ligase family protein [Persicimonas caeni]QDG53751.1 glutamate--cysteine ligase [Persicimonas caeni]QED34972.1 glutamate--cysteine ligase [Persicimonas caeni]